MRWWHSALAALVILAAVPSIAGAQTSASAPAASADDLETERAHVRALTDELAQLRRQLAANKSELDAKEDEKTEVEKEIKDLMDLSVVRPGNLAVAQVRSNDAAMLSVQVNNLKNSNAKIEDRIAAADAELQQATLRVGALTEAKARAEVEAQRAAAEKAANDKRIADAKAAEELRLKREAEERAAEERRIAREQAQEQRKWTLLYLVGGVTALLFGVFIALRAFGVSTTLSEWGKFYFWLVKAAVAVSFALFFLTAVETFFGALTIPDWMRRPLAELLNKASDAIDPEAKGAVK